MGLARTMREFKKLFHLYYEEMVAESYIIVQDQQTAEDIVQDLFIHLWESKQYKNITVSVRAYLKRSARNRSLNYLRDNIKTMNVSVHENQYEDNDASFESKDTHTFVERVLSNIPEKTRHIFLLNRVEDKSYKEIAKDLKLSEKTIEFHMSKALKILRKILKTHDIIGFVLLVREKVNKKVKFSLGCN
ncbi:MAG: RNA polymerase sigma-70 factor [Hyphomicrobiales bacterium]